MTKKEKKKPQHLDDFLDQLAQEHSKSLDESFKAFDEFMKEENQLHFYNNILAPAQDAMYTSLVSALDKEFDKKDETKLEKEEHHKKVKRAVGKALRTYFEKTNPHVVKAMDELKMGEEDQYEHLAGLYDEFTGADPRSEKNPGIRRIIDSLTRGKMTVGHVKKSISTYRSAAAEGALTDITEKYKQHHFGKYHKTQIAAYLKPKVENEGFQIEDTLGYARMGLDDLLKMRRGIIEKEAHPYLKKKEEKKK